MAENEILSIKRSYNECETEEVIKDHVTPWRQKFMLANAILIAFLAMGIGLAIPGATALDLVFITKSSVRDISWAFTGRSLGGLLGSLLLPVVLKWFKHWIPLTIAQLLSAVLLLMVPWCSSYYLMVAVLALYGINQSYVSAGGLTAMVDIWGAANGPWLSGLAAMYGIGCLATPLLAKSFIMSPADDLNETELNVNLTLGMGDKSNVYVPYTIIATLHVFSTLLLALASILTSKCWFIKSNIPRNDTKNQNKGDDSLEKLRAEKNQLHQIFSRMITFECIFSVLTITFVFLTYLIEYAMVMFLVTFVTMYLEWEKGQAMLLLTLFYAFSTISSVVCAILVKILHPKIIVIAGITLTMGSCVILAIGVNFHTFIIWLSISGIAFGNRPLFATGMTFTNLYTCLGAKLMSWGMVSSHISAIVSTFLFGAWYNSVGPIVFVYILVMAGSLMIPTFLLMFILGQKRGERFEISKGK